MKPAIRNPAPISFQSISQSPRKLCATSDQASTDLSRSRQLPADAAEVCWCPAAAASAWVRASASSFLVMKSRVPSHISAMRKIPPTNSASVNCQPMKIQRTIPISNTRFVDANWKTIAVAKLAPFWNIERAIAVAA